MKTNLFFLLLAFCITFLNLKAQNTNEENIKNLTAILKKPVPSGSTLRYEKLVEYISGSVSADQASTIIMDIKAKNSFGRYFYDRLSQSTVDKKILPLLSKVAMGQNVSTKNEDKPSKSNKPKPKNNNSDAIKNQEFNIRDRDITILKRIPLTIALPNSDSYKQVSEEMISSVIFNNQPEGFYFEKIADFVWQLKPDGIIKLYQLLIDKEHYFSPNIADQLFVIDPDFVNVAKINKDEFRILYSKNMHLPFSDNELIHAITKNSKLPEGIKIQNYGYNLWKLTFTDRGFIQNIIDNTI